MIIMARSHPGVFSFRGVFIPTGGSHTDDYGSLLHALDYAHLRARVYVHRRIGSVLLAARRAD
jgi:hypothetical protein